MLAHKKGVVISILEKYPFLMEFSRKCALQFIYEDDMAASIELIINDGDIDGTFNLAPDSYAAIGELLPGKRFVPVPLRAARAAAGAL